MASSQKGGIIVNIASDLSVFLPINVYTEKRVAENLQPVKTVTYSVISGLVGLTLLVYVLGR